MYLCCFSSSQLIYKYVICVNYFFLGTTYPTVTQRIRRFTELLSEHLRAHKTSVAASLFQNITIDTVSSVLLANESNERQKRNQVRYTETWRKVRALLRFSKYLLANTMYCECEAVYFSMLWILLERGRRRALTVEARFGRISREA